MQTPMAASAWGDLRAGVLTAVNLSPIDVGYGLLFLSAFGLAYAGQGIAAAFLAVAVANAVPAVLGGARGRSGLLFSGARPAQTLLLVELLHTLTVSAGSLPPLPQALVTVALTTFLAGGLQVGLGVLRFGGLMRYLPLSVLSGYINAVALLMVPPALFMVLGFGKGMSLSAMWAVATIDTLWAGLFGAVLAGLMALSMRWKARLHWSVVGLFGGALLYQVWIYALGRPLGDMLPAVGGLQPDWRFWTERPALSLDLLATVLPYALAIAVLNAVESLVAAARFEELADSRQDVNRMLVIQGLANAVGGLLGALPMAPSVSRVNIAWELGARRRRALAISAMTALFLMVVGGFLLPWVPYLVVGALMAFLAWTMIDAWTKDQIRSVFHRRRLEASRWRQVKSNLWVMALVVVVAAAGHLIGALAIGATAALFLFVREHARGVVGRRFSGVHRRSLVMRPEPESDYLSVHGEAIVLLEVNAPLVFGSAERLFDEMEQLPASVRQLVLDVQGVRDIDDKGARILLRGIRRLVQRGVTVRVAGLQPTGPRGSTLRAADAANVSRALPDSVWHDDADLALEAAESAILAGGIFSPHDAMDLRQLDIVAGMAPEDLAVLHGHLEAECFAAGATIFRHNEPGDRLYILAMGQVDIRLWLDAEQRRSRRMAAIAPGVVFGEMAMFRHRERSADAVAVRESAVWTLTRDALTALKQRHPAIASQLLCNIARQLSGRLAVTNDELVYATRH